MMRTSLKNEKEKGRYIKTFIILKRFLTTAEVFDFFNVFIMIQQN